MNSPAAENELGPVNSWVQFKSFSYSGTDDAATLLKSPQEQFLNPILAGFYPDPSICRVGDDYYLVNSSFWYFPGIPIFHSRDLVNWRQIGFVLDRVSDFESMHPADVSRGIFAPAIRYRDGLFYVITTMADGGGNFYVTAKDPAGPWSDLHWLKPVDGVDPSFFFDDDGRAYIVNCAPAPDDRPLYDGHRTIRIHEFDTKTGKITGGDKVLVNGGTDISKKPHWIEGPHIFKRNGIYYLIAAQGGTADAHSEVVFQSDSVWGPFVPFKGNPILTQRQLPADRPDPITCTGHADFVETSGGEWWAVFLGCRPYQRNRYNTGRETFLLPVRWENNWPIILKDDQIVPRIVPRPNLPAQPEAEFPLHGSYSWTDSFDGDRLNLRWNFLRAPAQQWYSLKEGSLLIAPRSVALTSLENPSFIACRQQHADFTAAVVVMVNPATAPCDAGLVAFQNESHYFFLGIGIDGGGARQVFVEQVAASAAGARSGPDIKVLAAAPLPEGSERVELKIEAAGRPYSFFYRAGGDFKPLKEKVDGSILSTDVAGGFQGVMLGIYARSR
ncbi:MAG: glycoside hydrolase family 43 protein [Tepidisphaeraceae bacterium]